MAQAERTLRLADVPAVPGDVEGVAQPNGDLLYISGDERWRTSADGTVIHYYMRGERKAAKLKALYRGKRR